MKPEYFDEAKKEHYFKQGDSVMFLWKYNDYWRKGIITGNNFAMCNLPDFFGIPEYYVAEVDENDEIDNSKPEYSVPDDSNYIVKFKPGMEWCIGESQLCYPKVRDIEQEKEDEYRYLKQNMRPFDMILVCVDGRWQTDMFEFYLDEAHEMIHTFKGHNILFDENWQPFNWEDNNYEQFKQLFSIDDNFVIHSHKDSYGPEGKSGDNLTDDYMNAHGDCPQIVYDKDTDYEYWTSTDSSKISDLKNKCKKTFDEYAEEQAQADKKRWENQFKNVSYDDYLKIPGIKEVVKRESEYREGITNTLNHITKEQDYMYDLMMDMQNMMSKIVGKIEDLEKEIESINTIHYHYSPNIPNFPEKYDPEKWKIYCTTTTNDSNNIKYEAHNKPGDLDNIMRCDANTSTSFDYKKYNDMCSCTNKEINAKYENSCLDAECYIPKGAIDTWGLAAADCKLKNGKNNKEND